MDLYNTNFVVHNSSSRDAILMSLILGQLVAHWLLIEVEKKGRTQKEGSEMTSLNFGKFEIGGTPKQSSLIFFPLCDFDEFYTRTIGSPLAGFCC